MANPKKTKVIIFNHQGDHQIKTSDGAILEVVSEFTYMGSLVSSTEADVKRRIGPAWIALNKLNKIWRSNLSKSFKTKLFYATIESVLLYGCETWTLTVDLEKRIDGYYTRLLRSALGYSWRDHITNKVLYGKLPKVVVVV